MDRKTSKKWDKYKSDFTKTNYDRIGIYLPKGEREIIQEHAKKCNLSTNMYILAAIQEKMTRDERNDESIKEE